MNGEDHKSDRSFYPREVLRGVDVGEQFVERAEGGQFGLAERTQVQSPVEAGGLQITRRHRGPQTRQGSAPVAGEQRLDAAGGRHPGPVPAAAPLDERAKQAFVQEGLVRGYGQHGIGRGHGERRQQAAERTGTIHHIRMHRQPEVGKAFGVAGDDDDLVSQALQDLDLAYDDGASTDHEPAFVPAAEATSAAAGDDGGGNGLRGHGEIMTDLRVGRLLPACLHQAIGEELPDRLEFYEHWLRSETLRDGAVGLAGIRAVLGFLRTEPAGAWGRVMARAGTLAAEWHFGDASGFRRTMAGWMPMGLRARSALKAARALMATTAAQTRATTRIRGASASVDVQASVFCHTRDRQTQPLCDFYLALVIATLRRFDLAASGTIESCHAMGADGGCRLALTLEGAIRAPQAEAA